MYNRLVFSALMILSLTTIFSQQTLQKNDTLIISLSDVWLKADEHSREIEIAKKEVEIRNEEILDTRLEVLPELAINGSAEKATNIPIYNNGLFHTPTQHEIIHTIYKVSGDFFLNIYNGNRLNLKIKETKVLCQLSSIQRDQTIANVRYESAKLYLELQKSYVFLHLVEKDIIDQEKQVEEIRAFNKNGVSLKNDVFRIELDLSRRKLLLLQIQNDILIANQKLNIIIGEPDDLKLIPQEFFNPNINHLPSYEECLQIAEHHSFQYHISEQKTELSKINLSQIKANYRPQIALTGEFYYSNPQIFLFPYNPYWYSLGLVGIKVSYPLSSVYHNLHKKRAAIFEVEKEEEAHHQTADSVRQQVNEAYLRYKESLIKIEVATVNVKQAVENARIIKNAYFNQTVLVTDLLDADVQVLQTEFELESAKIEAQINYYLLQNVLGII